MQNENKTTTSWILFFLCCCFFFGLAVYICIEIYTHYIHVNLCLYNIFKRFFFLCNFSVLVVQSTMYFVAIVWLKGFYTSSGRTLTRSFFILFAMGYCCCFAFVLTINMSSQLLSFAHRPVTDTRY